MMSAAGALRPPRPVARTRFTKSYKYKHKLKLKRRRRRKMEPKRGCDWERILCDTETGRETNPPPRRSISASAFGRAASARAPMRAPLIALVAALELICSIIEPLPPVGAFCPLKCSCNDVELSANCTQVGAISTVPMTLNPLLKRLTLNQLPISELSNSLALYRQLEQLNLNANQLRQVKYENFNFNSAPKMVQFSATLGARSRPSDPNEAHARQLKHSLERQLSLASDEIRFHLRELHLAGNRIEQLGEPQGPEGADSAYEPHKSLRGHELERLAPFLSLGKLELLDLARNKLRRLHQHTFLGLLRLKRLDLSHNQLEFVDRHALVGLLALEELNLSSNKLVRHQQQLAQLSQLICMGPLMELRQLDLSSNGIASAAESAPMEADLQLHHQRLVLPNQMFVCAPKLTRLDLRALRLRYIQVEAFEGLDQLQSLDLSENLFEQVPINTLRAARAGSQLEPVGASELRMGAEAGGQLASLRELKLNKNPIEFVNANSFENLKQLRRLEMSQSAQLVSFDLASLVTSAPNTNAKLEELRLSRNRKLEALRSSARTPIKLPQLQLLDLSGSGELREVHLEQMIDLDATSGRGALEVDISNSNNLNCSSCQLNWLIGAFKQRGSLATAHSRAHLHSEAPPAAGSPSGWAPIPFDPYNSFAPPSGQFKSALLATERPKVTLLNSDLIHCAWPFSMSLIELINLETNYAPLFGRACAHAAAEANRHSTRPNSSSLLTTNQMQFLSQQQQQQQRAGGKNLMSGSSGGASKQLHEQRDVAEGTTQSANSSAASALAIIGLLLVSAALLLLLARLRALVARRRKLHLNCSPSFTATTPIESPSSSAGGSSASGRHRAELVANRLAPERPVGAPTQAASYYYLAPGLVQRPAAPKASAVFQNAPPAPVAPNGQHNSPIGVQLSSLAAPTSASRHKSESSRRAGHSRPNLFSRFAARLSGGAAAAAAAAERHKPAPAFSGVGTALRFHGGRVPCGPFDLAQKAGLSTGRRLRADLGRGREPEREAEHGRPAACAQLIYANRLASAAQVEAAFEAQAAPSVANHYSICGDVTNEEPSGEPALACRAAPSGSNTSSNTNINYYTSHGQMERQRTVPEPASGVSARKNKRRRRRLDDNHTNGHLNQLHARHDYNQLEATGQPPAALQDEARFIYANS